MQSAVARIELELSPGERILWAGQPKRGLRFSSSDLFLIPFSVLWLAFAIFWTAMAFRITKPAGESTLNLLFPLFGLPFIIMGLYLTVGRFWQDARKRSRTYYAITNQRILAVSPSRKAEVLGLDLKNLERFEVTEEQRDGVGTLRFTPMNIRSFDRVSQIREVETILRSAQKERAARSGY